MLSCELETCAAESVFMYLSPEILLLACFAALRLELIVPLGLDEEKVYPLLLIMYVTFETM